MRFDKPDGSRKVLVGLLRSYGASWRDTPAVRAGEPDGVVGYAGVDQQAELKDEKGKLRPEQLEYHVQWRGATIVVLRTSDDVKALLEDMRQRGHRAPTGGTRWRRMLGDKG